MAKRLVTVEDVLAGHVTLDVRCLDRIYVNGYLPTVQVPGQVVLFLARRGSRSRRRRWWRRWGPGSARR